MSRKRKPNRTQQSQPQPNPPPEEEQHPEDVRPIAEKAEHPRPPFYVDQHRTCPRCFNERGGVGVAHGHYSVEGTKYRRYVCTKCRHRWAHPLVKVDALRTPEPPDIETR